MSGNVPLILDRVRFLLALRMSSFRHPPFVFIIVHRFQRPGTGGICAPGEEVAGIFLDHGGQLFDLKLSLSQRLVFDYLARTRLPQSASQIHAGIRAMTFYQKHAVNAPDSTSLRRRIARSSIKVHLQRIRAGIDAACRDADPSATTNRVLTSIQTCGNEVRFRLKASVRWQHPLD